METGRKASLLNKKINLPVLLYLFIALTIHDVVGLQWTQGRDTRLVGFRINNRLKKMIKQKTWNKNI